MIRPLRTSLCTSNSMALDRSKWVSSRGGFDFRALLTPPLTKITATIIESIIALMHGLCRWRLWCTLVACRSIQLLCLTIEQ